MNQLDDNLSINDIIVNSAPHFDGHASINVESVHNVDDEMMKNAMEHEEDFDETTTIQVENIDFIIQISGSQ